MDPMTEPIPLMTRNVQPRLPLPLSRKPLMPLPLRAAARTANGMTTIDATMLAMIVASSWMPKIRHQEPRTSLAERLIDLRTPCFSSMSAGEAREKRIISQRATTAAPSPPRTASAAAGAARPGERDDHTRQDTDADDRAGEERQQEGQTEQFQQLGAGVPPGLGGGDGLAEHRAAGDGGEQRRRDDGAEQGDEQDDARAEHGGAQGVAQLTDGGARVVEGVGVGVVVQEEALEQDDRDLRDHGDGQRDAQHRAPVRAHRGDRAVEDLADAERAQRDDAGLGGGGGPPQLPPQPVGPPGPRPGPPQAP